MYTCIYNFGVQFHTVMRFNFSTGCFDDEDIVHVEGDVDPARDLEIIHDELRLKDIEFLKKQMDPLEKTVGRGGEKGKKGEYVSGCSNVKNNTVS